MRKIRTLKLITILFLSIILIGTPAIRPLLAEENLGYADGYKDGKEAAKEDVGHHNPTLMGMGGAALGGLLIGGYVVCTLGRPSSIPQNRMLRIKDKPDAYQRGYVNGYREWIKKAWNKKCWGGAWIMIGIAAATYTLLMLASTSYYH